MVSYQKINKNIKEKKDPGDRLGANKHRQSGPIQLK